MSKNMNCKNSLPHIALFPGAGMGHLIPLLRLSAMLASHNCLITVIAVQPTVSAAESAYINTFFATHPHINRLNFDILHSTNSVADPFFTQFDAVSRSVHLLGPTLSALSPPLSAIFTDFVFAASISSVLDELSIANYIVATTSGRFFSVLAYLPYIKVGDTDIEIMGLTPFSRACIPPPLLDPNTLFASVAASNVPSLSKAKGILLNTFNWFEAEAVSALNDTNVFINLPPVLPIGPLEPLMFEQDHQDHQVLPWLDEQGPKSVVYISFGSRTTMSRDQMRELGSGLERSGHKFLWVLKGTKVDKEDTEQVQDLVGEDFLERMKKKGILVKGWAKQESILAHSAIGGFVSHCGWNSVIEAAQQGVPVMAWPQHGDQKINAEVVEKSGLGFWVRDWGWAGERLVKGEEIGDKIKELMEDENVRNKARLVGEEAKKSAMVNGSSAKALRGVIESLNPQLHIC